jgi:hypothetical protein
VGDRRAPRGLVDFLRDRRAPRGLVDFLRDRRAPRGLVDCPFLGYDDVP